AKDLNIDLSESWMIGDGENDVKAGQSAGCKTALITQNDDFDQDVSCQSLFDFAKNVLQ
ncbi:HAD hydrolase-like protein, partial [bacterium]|nr:HAD hydrolase-like protein [bacterium]